MPCCHQTYSSPSCIQGEGGDEDEATMMEVEGATEMDGSLMEGEGNTMTSLEGSHLHGLSLSAVFLMILRSCR